MALKAIMLRRSIDKKKAELETLRAKDADFENREKELEKAISETETEEQEAAVSEEVDKYEADKAAHESEKTRLAGDIDQLETELAATESSAPAPAPEQERTKPTTTHERGNPMLNMNIRALPYGQRVIDALPVNTRDAILGRPEVKDFLQRLRAMKGQTRAVTGAELSIPPVFLELISENMFRYSKLLNRVRVRNVGGQARQTIAGTIPEAIWTEMCGAINELNFVFNQITLDGYKVAGFVPICNSILEDNDINLAANIVEMLSESIGLADDKAILYGKGAASKMPLGIVTRLAQATQPSDYPANAPAWEDLHTSNILQIGGADSTGAAFWAELMNATSAAYSPYARGTQFWAMNSKTLATLRSKVITFTGTGDVVANVYSSLPIITGDIDILEFMPDGDIVGGYGDLYLFAVRGETTIDSSDQVMFLQDNTVFRAKQRADGAPVVPAAFVAININDAAVTTAMTFAADKANDAQLIDLKIGSESLSPTFDPTKLSYSVTATAASDKVEATAAQANAQIAITYADKNVRNGGTVTWTADGKAHPLTVTVTQGNAVRTYTINVTKASG